MIMMILKITIDKTITTIVIIVIYYNFKFVYRVQTDFALRKP